MTALPRRRFLAILAANTLVPARGHATEWQGRAFGADCSLRLEGDARQAEAALTALPGLLRGIEAEFSLHDPGSALCRLNATGRLPDASRAFRALIALADRVHRATDGAFDPTVQPLWQAAAGGMAPGSRIGWHHLNLARLTLPAGMALTLTLNGIAQGFATDAVRALLARHGFDRALIDIGEVAALGGPYRIGIEDPLHGMLGVRSLANLALATSSPLATLVAGQPHIRHPRGKPALWSSVTVEAESAAVADALSTALVFQGAEFIRALQFPGLSRVSVVTQDGALQQLR